jgi:amidase
MRLCKWVVQLSVIIILVGTFLGCGKQPAETARDTGPVYYQSATELAAAIRRGKITSTKLLNIYLGRIKRYNGKINAVVAMDVKAARARAAAADKALAQGKLWGPLHGLPMTVKDVFEVVGMPATSGSPKLQSYIPKRNAIAVQRLIDAGAIIFGKTNVPLFARDFQSFNKVYGTTNNPWDLARTPGGSSGGSAAALAVGFTPLELGSDLGGSIRVPSSYTGVYGHKPTFGLVPRYGHIPPPPGRVPPHIMPRLPLAVCGPMARSAQDLKLALNVLTTPGKTDAGGKRPQLLPARKKKFKDYRVAIWFTDSYPDAKVDAEVMAALLKTVKKLRNAGLQVEHARPGIDIKQDRQLFLDFLARMRARKLPNAELMARQKKQQAKWAAFFERYDVLLAPVTRVAAFPHNQGQPKKLRKLVINGRKQRYMSNLTWMLMAIVSGLPATVAPVGLSESGLPVGVQIIGPRLGDRTTIAFAQGLSKLTGGFTPPPGYNDGKR